MMSCDSKTITYNFTQSLCELLRPANAGHPTSRPPHDRLHNGDDHRGGGNSVAWDPAQYLKFADERLRPGFDLLARVGDLPPGPIFELGSGTGVHTRAIAARWPDRPVAGIDSSREMLAQAAAEPSRIDWVEADIR